MSAERDLLKRCFEYIYPSFESNLLCDEIEELLAQPETCVCHGIAQMAVMCSEPEYAAFKKRIGLDE